VALFLLGVAIGAFGAYALGRYGPYALAGSQQRHDRNTFVKQLTSELDLTADQQQQLQTIINDTRAKYRALYEPLRPQQEQIRQQGRDKIRAILAPEQRPKFEDFLRRLDEQHKKEENR
jgi:Spy/CpxP family protein refolding chaperone